MKPYVYYKLKAHEKLRPNFLKAAAVGLFSTFLTVFLNIILSHIEVESVWAGYLIPALISFFILYPLSMGAGIFYLKTGRGEKPSAGTVFDGYIYFKKLIPYMTVNSVISFLNQYTNDLYFSLAVNGKEPSILLSLAVILSMFLVALAGIYLVFTFFIIYDNKELSGIKAVYESFKMQRGNIIYFTGFFLSFFLWMLFAVITAGLATIYLIPYMEISMFMMYEDMKNKNKENEAEGE